MMLCFHCMIFLVTIISINSSTNEIESTTQSLADTIYAKVKAFEAEIKKEENELKLNRTRLEEDKQLQSPVYPADVIELNVDGEMIATTRQTLTKISQSILSTLFNGRWEQRLTVDDHGNIRVDFNPTVFRHLLHQLQTFDSNNPKEFHPPSQPSLVEPFKKMIRQLRLQHLLPSEKKQVITFNLGGQIITNRRTTLTAVSNSTSETIVSPLTIMNFNHESDVFVDYDPKIFRHLIDQLRSELFTRISSLGLSSNEERTSFRKMLIDLNIPQKQTSSPNFKINQTWKQFATTVAGGHGKGNGSNQLSSPWGMFIDDDQTIYIADTWNHRIVEWKNNSNHSQIVAGGNGEGNRNDQLDWPTSMIIDQQTDSLIICDQGNRRVVRWPRRNGEVLISNIDCWDLKMDKDRYLYISDTEKHEVRRWKIGEENRTIVAGGNGQGSRLDQLNDPRNIFIDDDHSVYVSDTDNHRVMKWMKDAKEGIVVAGGQSEGNGLNQLSYPHRIIVDQLGSVYVADYRNARVMRWLKAAEEGTIVVGGHGGEQQANQLDSPVDLSFDRENNLYVLDFGNQRVQRFDVN